MSAERPRRSLDRPRRRPTDAPPAVERLDARTLLSGSGLPGPHPLHLVHPLQPAAVRSPISDHNPLRERVRDGQVFKRFPHFYETYHGPRLPGLSAVEATAHLVPGRGFVFTGTMLGPIDPTVNASYVFAIDRGGARAPGPFVNRSDIFFDSTVAVTTGPAGVTGVVTVYKSNGQVPQTVLPAQDVSVQGDTVSVTVDPSLLPPTSTPRTRLKLTEYRFTLWTELGAVNSGPIADFIPEYSLAPFAIPRR